MPIDESIRGLSQELFWDVDRESVNARDNARWLVERVLERGTWDDWLIVKGVYGKDGLRTLWPSLRLDPKSAYFLSLYCGT